MLPMRSMMRRTETPASPKPPQAIVHSHRNVFGYKQDEFGRPAILSRESITAYAHPSREIT
jgi:hypothetical protein